MNMESHGEMRELRGRDVPRLHLAHSKPRDASARHPHRAVASAGTGHWSLPVYSALTTRCAPSLERCPTSRCLLRTRSWVGSAMSACVQQTHATFTPCMRNLSDDGPRSQTDMPSTPSFCPTSERETTALAARASAHPTNQRNGHRAARNTACNTVPDAEMRDNRGADAETMLPRRPLPQDATDICDDLRGGKWRVVGRVIQSSCIR